MSKIIATELSDGRRIGIRSTARTPIQVGGIKGDPGKSTYELWLELPGNEGKSVEEFIDSFNGVVGKDGKSAYEIWASLPGNEGKSIADFIASLKGRDGIDGNDGKDGKDGVQGEPGPAGGPMGPQGPQGVPGATGAVGPQGAQGAQGPKGEKGDKGDKGEPGTPGEQGPGGGLIGMVSAVGSNNCTVTQLDAAGQPTGQVLNDCIVLSPGLVVGDTVIVITQNDALFAVVAKRVPGVVIQGEFQFLNYIAAGHNNGRGRFVFNARKCRMTLTVRAGIGGPFIQNENYYYDNDNTAEYWIETVILSGVQDGVNVVELYVYDASSGMELAHRTEWDYGNTP